MFLIDFTLGAWTLDSKATSVDTYVLLLNLFYLGEQMRYKIFLAAVLSLFVVTTAFGHPLPGDPVSTIPVESRLKLNQEINVPRGQAVRYFAKGKVVGFKESFHERTSSFCYLTVESNDRRNDRVISRPSGISVGEVVSINDWNNKVKHVVEVSLSDMTIDEIVCVWPRSSDKDEQAKVGDFLAVLKREAGIDIEFAAPIPAALDTDLGDADFSDI